MGLEEQGAQHQGGGTVQKQRKRYMKMAKEVISKSAETLQAQPAFGLCSIKVI